MGTLKAFLSIITYMLHTSYLREVTLSMITSGLKDAAPAGSIAAAILIIIFIVFKTLDRRRYE